MIYCWRSSGLDYSNNLLNVTLRESILLVLGRLQTIDKWIFFLSLVRRTCQDFSGLWAESVIDHCIPWHELKFQPPGSWPLTMVKISDAFVLHDEFACGSYDCGWVLGSGAYKDGQSGKAVCLCGMMVPPADAGCLARSSASGLRMLL